MAESAGAMDFLWGLAENPVAYGWEKRWQAERGGTGAVF